MKKVSYTLLLLSAVYHTTQASIYSMANGWKITHTDFICDVVISRKVNGTESVVFQTDADFV